MLPAAVEHLQGGVGPSCEQSGGSRQLIAAQGRVNENRGRGALLGHL